MKSPTFAASLGSGELGSHLPTAWTCSPWKPGVRPLTSTVTVVPASPAANDTVPICAPAGLTIVPVANGVPAEDEEPCAAASACFQLTSMGSEYDAL